MGILLIALEGLIHLLDAPDSFEEAAYKGLLFAAIVLGAVVAVIGIYRGHGWGWGLGVLIAGSAFVGYVISRTIGLPGLPVDEWLEPLGILSLLVEGLFVGLYLAVSIHRRTSLRACLVSERVRVEEAESASFPQGTACVGRFCGVASSVLAAFLPKRAIRGRPSAYAGTPNRFNPHPYQTGSKGTPIEPGEACER